MITTQPCVVILTVLSILKPNIKLSDPERGVGNTVVSQGSKGSAVIIILRLNHQIFKSAYSYEKKSE
jgi:hypothetical protein